MTRTNPIRSPYAHRAVVTAIALVVVAVVMLLVTANPITDADARPAAPAPSTPLLQADDLAEPGALGAQSLQAAVVPVADTERVSRFLAAAARAEAARLEAERVQRFLDEVARVQAAEQAAAARAAEARRAAASAGSSSMGGGWAALRRCESGGNYGAVSSSGTYRGAYQFSRSTWNSVASRSYPHLVGVDPAAAAPGGP
ncbi:MAG: transglycosylase family protein, partial [Microthrixaceae bacterium]